MYPDFDPAEFKEAKRLRLGEWSANQSEFNYLEEKSKNDMRERMQP